MSNEDENIKNLEDEKKTEEMVVDLNQISEKIQHENEILKDHLEKEKQNTNDYIEKWKRALADYENLSKRSTLDISNKVTNEVNKIILNFLTVYEDLIRAKNSLVDDQKSIDGLDGIIKNMSSIFNEYNIQSIDTVGQIFNPNLHEAVSIVEDENLDDDIITEEVAKGYISGDTVIKPSKVIVSKKSIKNE
jgi:molecular chaperone GrpE